MSTGNVFRDDLKRSIGPEAGEYLDQIDGAIEGSPERFAVIKVGGEMAQGDYLDQLSGSVAHLSRLGYLPVLVHGGGPQINRILNERNIPEERIDGDRITSAAAMEGVESALKGVSSEIKNSLASQNILGTTMSRPFKAELKDEQKLGMVGTPTDIDIERIARIVRDGKIPIIACLGEVMVGGQLKSANINGDDAAAKLVEILEPEKFITLTKPGGVMDDSGRIIPNLTAKKADELIKSNIIKGGMEKKVSAVLALMGENGVREDGVITHPSFIIPELFTHEGAGTLITRDIAISRSDNMNGLDLKRTQELIEDAFGGHLREDYFSRLELDGHSIYITPQRYDGIGIVREVDGFNAHYMDKLAVTPGEQGRGIADQILELIASDTEASGGFFWRAAPEAVFMNKYESFADETHHVEGPDGREWTVFCKNMYGHQIPNAVTWAANKPITIERHPEDAPF